MKIGHQERANGASFFTEQELRSMMGALLRIDGIKKTKDRKFYNIGLKIKSELNYLQSIKPIMAKGNKNVTEVN